MSEIKLLIQFIYLVGIPILIFLLGVVVGFLDGYKEGVRK